MDPARQRVAYLPHGKDRHGSISSRDLRQGVSCTSDANVGAEARSIAVDGWRCCGEEAGIIFRSGRER